ncbi:hypothetical protein GIB67_012062 [Kingdonia uniflora]|uniref:Uncharacterized protein n=1 Tax=Kingdonia uniflora TaxID=39325 RepID=A0A7J7M0B1_9MAGN|nr:hypothetical protein GIB67_012062 [Kingdonia uniflora]
MASPGVQRPGLPSTIPSSSGPRPLQFTAPGSSGLQPPLFTVPGSSGSRPAPFGAPSYMSSPLSASPPSSILPPSALPSSIYSNASPLSHPVQELSSFPRAGPPPPRPPQASGRPIGPPFSQTPSFGPRPSLGALPSTGRTVPGPSAQSPMTSGPPFLARATHPSFTNSQHPQSMVESRGLRLGQTLSPFPVNPPSVSPLDYASQPSLPFSVNNQGMPPLPPPPYGHTMTSTHPPQGPPPGGAYIQPPGMYGLPPVVTPEIGCQFPLPGGRRSGSSKIDHNQILRPIPVSSAAAFETWPGVQPNSLPPASSDYVVKDTGNCSPRYMRCSINQIPCTGDLLSTSSMPLTLMVQPLALPHPSDEPIQVIDFGDIGPIRCSRCKGYINPFMKFVDQGKRFICNLCGFMDETPRDYHCNLGPDNRRRDVDDRPELCRGTVEFVATKEYMKMFTAKDVEDIQKKKAIRPSRLEKASWASQDNKFCGLELSYAVMLLRIFFALESVSNSPSRVPSLEVRDPMPAVFFFLVDVSMNAIQTGATAAACSGISQAITDLPVRLHLELLLN